MLFVQGAVFRIIIQGHGSGRKYNISYFDSHNFHGIDCGCPDELGGGKRKKKSKAPASSNSNDKQQTDSDSATDSDLDLNEHGAEQQSSEDDDFDEEEEEKEEEELKQENDIELSDIYDLKYQDPKNRCFDKKKTTKHSFIEQMMINSISFIHEMRHFIKQLVQFEETRIHH